ncbi:MAG: PIN domain-containing protein [Thermotogae bacterium]|nr:PIN domain-containing protein [Thermotogota bacterium]
MRYLLDANIILEVMTGGKHYAAVKSFLEKVSELDLYITWYSVFSIGILLNRHGLTGEFIKFLRYAETINVILLRMRDLYEIPKVISEYNLDFDDAYQYVAAEKYNLIIVSYDSDFKRTPCGRKTPEEILNEL